MRPISAIIGASLMLGVGTLASGGRAPTAATAAGDHQVFRSYGAAGGLRSELESLAEEHADVAELVTIGETVRGDDLVALRVTADASEVADGARPAILYLGAQHAREWITPEIVRRLARHVLDGYGSDATLTELVATTELWFVPVANPDGYDYTFTPGHRLWRKNLRDNDGDGQITAVDGVDLNRNYPTRWGYDDEGSSPDAGGATYRGAAPASEPETRAVDRLMERIGFEYLINYHAASEAVLYGTSWQVSTPTPDDALYQTLAGSATDPAVPGLGQGLFADLYSANGLTDEHAHVTYGTLAFTVETSTCQTAAASDAADRWEPADCGSALEFPDDEALVAAEFRKNLPFALVVARSAVDPDDPVTTTGRRAPEFVIDPFDVSFGDGQPVAVVARRDQAMHRLAYRVGGGATQYAAVTEWEGGERYGDERNRYYVELRGQVTGTAPGDSVEVWFTARREGRDVESEHFTYTVVSDTRADVLIIANEDYTGVNPDYSPVPAGPKYVDDYAAALDANGITHAEWDVDAQGVPHPLGVLSHFDAVVWETGDDRLAQDPEDALTDTFLLGPLPDLAVAERQHFLTMALRDYLNEGGHLVQAGESAQYFGLLGRSLGGIYYGLSGAPDQDCAITRDFLSDCLLLSDDFAQYYLGAAQRAEIPGPAGIAGRGPLDAVAADFGGPALAENPLDRTGAFALTSDVLAPEEHPQFAGAGTSTYRGAQGVNPFGPVEGSRYAGALAGPVSYQRIGRTIDLTDVVATAVPTLRMMLSYSTLQSFHSVIVEAAPSGTDEWTTLADLDGRTLPVPPGLCAEGSLLPVHPFLAHYLSPGNPCVATGTTGAWNAFTGDSGGWVDVAFDLSPYAGRRVDVKIGYVTDDVVGVVGGIGVFVDDIRLMIDGAVVDADGFESTGGSWTVEGPPPGSPSPVASGFVLTGEMIAVSPTIATEDTALLGFGIESLATDAERADVLGRIIGPLLGR